jgi:hypothetical protein
MGSVLRREVEVVAPLASELSGAGQSLAESSRGVLLCCHFLLLLRMVTVTVPVPRFRLESRCSHRRRVVFKVVVVVVRGDGDLGGTASLGKEKKSDPLKVRPLVGPTPKSIYTVEKMPEPPNISCSVASPPPDAHFAQWVSRQTAAKPRNADLGKHPQLTGTREVVSGSSQSARPIIKVLALCPGAILSRSQQADTPARRPQEAPSLKRRF